MERSENNPQKKAPGGKLISSISSPSRLLRMGGGGGARAMAGAVDAVYLLWMGAMEAGWMQFVSSGRGVRCRFKVSK